MSDEKSQTSEARLRDWLRLIADIAYDRDGYFSANDLGSLVDELGFFANLALRGEDPNIMEPLTTQPKEPNFSPEKAESTKTSISLVVDGLAGKVRGSVTCPRCGGELRYINHPSVGVTSAVCMTKGCLAWSFE